MAKKVIAICKVAINIQKKILKCFKKFSNLVKHKNFEKNLVCLDRVIAVELLDTPDTSTITY